VPINVKICGIDTIENVDVAIEHGADYIGFVFYEPSPRNLSAKNAARLTLNIPKNVVRVGLFVDPSDIELSSVLELADIDLIQLHGCETPERVAAIKHLTKLPILKAIKVAKSHDLESAYNYFNVADHLLFDSKAPITLKNSLPGGNALIFDWRLLQGLKIPLPWMLAGGLNANNIIEAITTSGATTIDVSSGVENMVGVKDNTLIKELLKIAKAT
jgi:phosphoribosylanthranilate isomerase